MTRKRLVPSSFLAAFGKWFHRIRSRSTLDFHVGGSDTQGPVDVEFRLSGGRNLPPIRVFCDSSAGNILIRAEPGTSLTVTKTSDDSNAVRILYEGPAV